MADKKAKPESDLIEYLANVRYELDMMRHNLRRAREASAKGDEYQLDYNSAYESWAIHARNLYKFLNNDDDSRTNYQAHDYVADFSGKKTDDSKRILDKLGPEIFHMGTRRSKSIHDQVQLSDVNVFSEWVEDAFEDFLVGFSEIYQKAWREPSSKRNDAVTYVLKGGSPQATNHIMVSSSVRTVAEQRQDMVSYWHLASNRCAAQFRQQDPNNRTSHPSSLTDEGTLATTNPVEADCRSAEITRRHHWKGLASVRARRDHVLVRLPLSHPDRRAVLTQIVAPYRRPSKQREPPMGVSSLLLRQGSLRTSSAAMGSFHSISEQHLQR